MLVRHATAGDRATWRDDDRLRPLDDRGRRQAAALPTALSELPIGRILTSPYVRCVQTVEPLAAALDLEIEEAAVLAEGSARAEVLPLLANVAAGTALCSHGDVCHELVGPLRTPKGSAWVLDVGARGVVPVRHIPAPA
ncbi:MAG TPA: histidine phosphatase family protein [Gaiellales bacterium]